MQKDIYTLIVRKNKTYTANLSTALEASDTMFSKEVVIKLKKTYYRSQGAAEQKLPQILLPCNPDHLSTTMSLFKKQSKQGTK